MDTGHAHRNGIAARSSQQQHTAAERQQRKAQPAENMATAPP